MSQFFKTERSFYLLFIFKKSQEDKDNSCGIYCFFSTTLMLFSRIQLVY